MQKEDTWQKPTFCPARGGPTDGGFARYLYSYQNNVFEIIFVTNPQTIYHRFNGMCRLL